MILIVCGGRHYDNRRAAWAALDATHAKRPITLLVHGGATDADTLADDWAVARNVPRRAFSISKFEWRQHGHAAGPMRNARMLTEAKPDGVLALPGDRGTSDMMRQARAAGVPVWVPYRSQPGGD